MQAMRRGIFTTILTGVSINLTTFTLTPPPQSNSLAHVMCLTSFLLHSITSLESHYMTIGMKYVTPMIFLTVVSNRRCGCTWVHRTFFVFSRENRNFRELLGMFFVWVTALSATPFLAIDQVLSTNLERLAKVPTTSFVLPVTILIRQIKGTDCVLHAPLTFNKLLPLAAVMEETSWNLFFLFDRFVHHDFIAYYFVIWSFTAWRQT